MLLVNNFTNNFINNFTNNFINNFTNNFTNNFIINLNYMRITREMLQPKEENVDSSRPDLINYLVQLVNQ